MTQYGPGYDKWWRDYQQLCSDNDLITNHQPDERNEKFIDRALMCHCSVDMHRWSRWLAEGLDFDAFKMHVEAKMRTGKEGWRTSASAATGIIDWVESDK